MGVNLPAQSASPLPTGSHGDVPVKEVVLFSSGVGYFQHEGTVQGDGATELRFKTTQINDILKSLVLQDLDGGRVGVVTYPSQDPLEKTLGSFQVDISDNPSLGDLLNKLRGARITLAYTGPNGVENFPGTVLGVEEKEVAAASKPDAPPFKKSFLNLVTDRGIRSLELDRVDKLELDDPGLTGRTQPRLGRRRRGARPGQEARGHSFQRHGRAARAHRLRGRDAGLARELPARAAAEGRRQKGDVARLGAGRKPDRQRLEGCEAEPRQRAADFVHRKPLYTPLYVPRPTVVPELYASLRPQEYEGGHARMRRTKSVCSRFQPTILMRTVV